MKLPNIPRILILAIFIAFILRIFLARYGTYYSDLFTYQLWSLDLIRYGFKGFYDVAKADYPPGYLYILWITGKLFYWLAVHLPQFAQMETIYKLPSIFSDLGNGIFIYFICLKYTSIKKSLLVAIFYLFNPAILANSTLWGQIDSFLTFFLISSFYFLIQKKFILAAFLLAFGQVVKPIAIFGLPFYLLYMYAKKENKKNFLILGLTFFISTIILFIPFNKEDNIILFIIKRYQIINGWFAYATLNSFNIWSAISAFHFGTIDKISVKNIFLGVSFENWGNIMFGSAYLAFFIHTYKKLKNSKNQIVFLVFALMVIYLSFFMLMTKIRERHLFFGISFLTLLLPILSLKKMLIVGIFYIAYLFNLFYAYAMPSDNPLVLPPLIILFLSLINLTLFVYTVKIFYSNNY